MKLFSRVGSRRLLLGCVLVLAGCGAETSLLVSIECDLPACDLSVPTDIDYIDIVVINERVPDDPISEGYTLDADDGFPLTLSIQLRADIEEDFVTADVSARLGGETGTVVANGNGRIDIAQGYETELEVKLTGP